MRSVMRLRPAEMSRAPGPALLPQGGFVCSYGRARSEQRLSSAELCGGACQSVLGAGTERWDGGKAWEWLSLPCKGPSLKGLRVSAWSVFQSVVSIGLHRPHRVWL